MTYQENYEVWKKALAGTEYEQEIADVAKDSETLQDSFYKEMEFGTAGMRGIIGMGTNRMNVFTVKRATQALANNILAHGDPLAGVAIAYDTRKNSDLFARETAGVLCANGINVFMYDTPHSVPQLSFTILELNTTAGVVITDVYKRQRQRNVACSRRHIYQHYVHIRPDHIRPELLDRARDNRPAPHDRLRFIRQQKVDGHNLYPFLRLHRKNRILRAPRFFGHAKHFGNRRACDIRVQNRCAKAFALKEHCQHGGHEGFSLSLIHIFAPIETISSGSGVAISNTVFKVVLGIDTSSLSI